MFYKPNYCCNCGEKVERVEWRLWTSRRFCDVCETEYQLDDWLKRLIPWVFLLLGIFGIGSYLQDSEKPLNIAQNDKSANLRALKSLERKTRKESSPENRESNSNNGKGEKDLSIKEQNSTNKQLAPSKQNTSPIEKQRQQVFIAKSPQKKSDETVYFCGAATKKGTPCSRKVKGGGRCWQHKGRKAILSSKELLAESN